MNMRHFKKIIWSYYRKHGRDLAWRRTKNPYHIMVSEIMLQQTHVDRVAKKYPAFINAFPQCKALADAPLKNIIEAWQGMGYNRRAVYLKKIAEAVMEKHGGKLPTAPEVLEQLPGIGRATAHSIAAFAYNRPVAFIETNIRSVFIHAFFPRTKIVSDAEIMPLVEQTIDRDNPREWYYALMDYGAMLKTSGNPSRRSAHYARQKPFKGSHRELRGKIVKTLIAHPRTLALLHKKTQASPEKLCRALEGLARDGLIKKRGAIFAVA